MTVLVIAGHHRSGTSVLAQLLAKAGLFVGDKLLGASESNPYGHFEDVDVVAIHDRLLADNGLNWQVDRPFIPYVARDVWRDMSALLSRRRRAHALWGFKDPRVCLFLPLWRHLIDDLRVVATFRSPGSCAHSIERRQARDLLERKGPAVEHARFWQEPDHSSRLWLQSNVSLLRHIRSDPLNSHLTAFDDIEADRDIVGSINNRWSIGLIGYRPRSVFDTSAATTRDRPVVVHDQELATDIGRTWRELVEISGMTRETWMENDFERSSVS